MTEKRTEPALDVIAGRNAVKEALRSARPIESILVARGARNGSLGDIVSKAKAQGVAVKEVDPKRLEFLCPGANHQGIAALAAAHEVGYPVLVRPSYVLGGQGMEIAYSDRNIEEFMRIINLTVQEHPILIDKYLMGRELEVDGVFDGEDILIPGIMEHVERAGVHSGDSIAVYPPLHLEDKHRELILKHTKNMAKHLGVIGLINAQYILYNDDIYVIEVNPRSSRTIPYISKVTGVPIIDLATKVMLGQKLKDLEYGTGIYREADYYAVKAPVFSFEKLTDVDTGLGPEMKSTGEVLGLAETFPQALLKAFKGAGLKAPKRGGRIIITVKDEDKQEIVGIARGFEEMGIELFATSGTCDVLQEAGIECKRVNRVSQAHPNILDMIASGTVDLIINTPTKGRKHDTDGFRIRRSAVEHSVGCITAIDTARAIEGMPRNTSTHAAGVVITRKPVYEYVPLAKNDESVVCQYIMTTLEELGLLKMDFLGLRNLTVLDDAVKMVQTRQPDFTLDDIPEGDPETYKMLSDGKTNGVFQMESTGMTGVCVGLKPQSIEDITAIIALYRPGPMDSIPKFIACKHDPSKVSYIIPELEPILSITYGCIVYQEQVIQIFQQLAGYTLGQADMLRRAMSKKKAKDVAKEREAFLHGDPSRNIKGCVANGIDPAAAEKIYDEIFAFANYAFNKAHAVSYAVVAYQTAYFKCHFTREYMAALLTSVLDNSDKVSGYIGECRECGIALLPPDINRSADRFTVEEGGIRFGLVAIKNIGRGFIQAVMRERETGGDFTSLYDFCSRMNGSEMNKRAVENLIRSGAFDSMGARRSQLIKVYESVMDSVAAQQRENVEGQMDFFSMAADNDEKSNSVKEITLPDIPEYTPEELMTMEKATTGLYLSGHPMDHYRDAVRKLHAPTIVSIIEDFSRENGPERFTDGQRITIAGVITSSKTKTTKNNSLMAYVMVEDDTASMELLCFSRVLETCGAYMKENQAVVVKGRLSVRDEKAPQIMCDSIYPLSTVEGGIPEPQPKQETAAGETLFLKFPSINDPAIRHMKLVFQMFPGKSVVKMVMADTRKVYATQALLHPALVQEAQETLGHENVVVK